MSGGVDSSVAALLLRRDGYDLVGLTMCLVEEDTRPARAGRGCCGVGAVVDARKVASRLGMPHYVLNFREVFEELVVADFVEEYARGRTPNPCIRCNERVKFRVLLRRAEELGCSCLATGHHARIDRGPGGEWRLRRGADGRKDQSYFLYTFTQEQLARVLMPVGAHTKDEVRGLAAAAGLPVADRPESQEICFVPGDDYVAFLRDRRPGLFRPGPVLDTGGNVLGEHRGIAGFTVGQRRGLGIAFGERRYVVRLDPERNAVVLGSEQEACGREAPVDELSWVAGRAPVPRFRATARPRYRHPGAPAEVSVGAGGRADVTFDEPQWAITPGQALVLYDGDVVLGGGTITRTDRTRAPESNRPGNGIFLDNLNDREDR